MEILDKKQFIKEINSHSNSASSVISDLFTVYELLKSTNQLPFNLSSSREFEGLVDKYQTEFGSRLTKRDSEKLIDYLNLLIQNKEDLKSSTINSSDILKSYSKSLKNLQLQTEKEKRNRIKELRTVLKTIGASNQEISNLDKLNTQSQISSYLEKLATKSKFSSSTSFEFLNESLSARRASSSKTISKFSNTKDSGGKSSRIINSILDEFEFFRQLKELKSNKLSELSKEESNRRIQESNDKYIRRLREETSRKEDEEKYSKQFSDNEELLQETKKGLKDIDDSSKDLKEELESIKKNTKDLLLETNTSQEILQKISQSIRDQINQEELNRLKEKDFKSKEKSSSESEGSILDDLTDSFDRSGKKKGKKRGRKGKKAKRIKSLPKAGKTSSILNSSKGLMKGAMRGAGKALPWVAAAMMAKDAWDGFDEEKANELGFDGTTTKGKTNSSISEVLSGLTFGLVDNQTMAEGVKLKDQLDDSVVDFFGGKDSILGTVADKIMNPLDNLADSFDSFFKNNEDKKEEEKKLTSQGSLLDPTSAINSFNKDVVDNSMKPLANGFQNMFDYMSEVPGIGEFFKEKSSKPSTSSINRAKSFFNPFGMIGSLGGLFSSVARSPDMIRSIPGKVSDAISTSKVMTSSITTGDIAKSADKFVEHARSQGVSDEDIQYALANMIRETGNFTKTGENMNYKSVERIMQVHGNKIRKWGGDPRQLVNNPEALSNIVYSDHYGSKLGNIEQGDGWKFRGRGLVQLTGRENYKKIGDMIGIDLVSNPDLVEDPNVSPLVAHAYLKMKKAYGKGMSEMSDRIIGNTSSGHGAMAKAIGYQSMPIAKKFFEGSTERLAKNDYGGKEPKIPVDSSKLISSTKVTQNTKDLVDSGKINLFADTKAQASEGYSENQQYFVAPKGQISENDVSKLDPNLYSNLNKMAHAYLERTGKKLIVTNSYRSREEQAKLYRLAQEGKGNPANKPGFSLHEYGLAIDIKPEQARELESTGMLKEFGFYRPLPNHPKEQQHVQPISIASSQLSGTGDTQVFENQNSTVNNRTENTNNITSVNENSPVEVSSSRIDPIKSVSSDGIPSLVEQDRIESKLVQPPAQPTVVKTSSQPVTVNSGSQGGMDQYDDFINDVGLSMFNKFQLG